MEEDGDGTDEARGDERGIGFEVVPGCEGGAVRGRARGEAVREPAWVGKHHVAAVGGGREVDVSWELFVADEAVGPGIGEVDFEDIGSLMECGFGDGEDPGGTPNCAAGLAIDTEGESGGVDGPEGECREVEGGRCGRERDGIAVGGRAGKVLKRGVFREGPIGEGGGFEWACGAVE